MMVSVESSGALERRMRVQVPANEIDQKVSERLKQVGRNAKVEGFRPGKVPSKVVAKRYGPQIRQEVISEVMQSSYAQAIQKESLSPAGNPSIETETTDAGEDFAYIATFEVFPEVALKDLDKMSIELAEVEIEDADVDKVIDSLRTQRSTWEPVERAAGDGDQVIVDFDGKLDGEEIPNGSGKNVPVELGAGQMLDDFENALGGIAAGETREFDVSYPDDYPAEELAGKVGQFTATVSAVNERIVPEIDEEFVKSFGVEDGSLDTLKSEVRQNMQSELDTKQAADAKQQVFEQLLEHNPIEVPNALVHQEAAAMQQQAMRQMGIEDPEKAPPLTEFLTGATRRVQISLLIQEFISVEKLELDRSRIPEKIKSLFAGYDENEEMVANYANDPRFLQQIEPMVMEEQAIEALRTKGTESSKKVGFQEYMDAR
ncbi:MAG: trigger factor [Pseudomonadota bacterium]